MKIIPQKRYLKHFSKLPEELKFRTKYTIRIFEANPFDIRLHNHGLAGDMNGVRAISVTSDIRIIFQEFYYYKIVLFLDIGTHNQVY